ncbi:Inosine-5'-monophosphate dehydrogenase [Paramagnetospirillum magnetotacticum MS-1]|uniref:Inosine-5'-monophosphate dehydrogenase n=1 Tax=Paramagnetospirillum magnetotacticum MS-1 TaxID=272627 RepID=A0A0C2YBB8_PARME|nr:CBS domain-containing protein [Paramagnetospirillum magnetotacticum]KIL97039.1 Inosine-5'-monophosphate dehydrogenase [Paramagnetospirillum magnetotacticum MS-1]
MRISDVLGRKGHTIHTVAPSASLREAASLLLEKNIGALICSDRAGGIVGILSERDISRSFARLGADIISMSVSDAMTRDVIACSADDGVAEILEIMTETRCRHIPVVGDGELLGLVSIGDLVKALKEEG